MRRLAWTALIFVVLAWLCYTALELSSVQSCVTNKQNEAAQEQTEKDFPEFVGPLIIGARVRTGCLGLFLYENRDAVTAVATAFIALFTFTLWWSTWSLLKHGREVERAYMGGGGARYRLAQEETDDDGNPFIKCLDTGLYEFHVHNHGKTRGRVLSDRMGLLRGRCHSAHSPNL